MHGQGKKGGNAMNNRPLSALTARGQSIWLDDLSRDMLNDGSLERYIRDFSVRGLTSNPATFGKAIDDSRAYDAQLRQLIPAAPAEVYEAITTRDVQGACDLLRPVYDSSQGTDGFASLEVSPHLARDARASVDEAHRLWQRVDRPNLMIKIPGTGEGLAAIEDLLTAGLNVNVTLLFSVERYRAVTDAWLRALERRRDAGQSPGGVHSVASFFLSRIDVLVDELLAHRLLPDGSTSFEPDPNGLRGRAALANARIAYATLRRILRSDRWSRLAEHGAQPQRLLWASTGTKNDRYSDVMYVEPLIGEHTVSTLPIPTLEAFAEHGRVASTARKGVTEARAVVRDLRKIGIDLRQVAWQLENEGIQKFIEPYDRSHQAIERKMTTSMAETGEQARTA
jgi:transaldolase